MFEKLQQDDEGLFLNLDAGAVAAQFVRPRVKLKCAEAVHRGGVICVRLD